MKFYKGDIVDIISLGRYDDQNVTLGYKYYVAGNSFGFSTPLIIDSFKTISFDSCRIAIYKRPLRNHLKHFLSEIKFQK